MSDFAEDITASLSADERFGGCRFAEMYNAEETGFPLKAPLICIGREECERMEPLIGKDECLLSSEKLILSVCGIICFQCWAPWSSCSIKPTLPLTN